MKRQRHDTKATTRAFTYLVIVLAIIMLSLNIKLAVAQSWDSEPDVYINTANEPMSTVGALNYALWSIEQRSGRSGNFAGYTSANANSWAINVRWVSKAYIQSLTGSSFDAYTTWSWSGSSMTNSEVMLAYDAITGQKQLTNLMIHELGHALSGEIHHSGENGVFRAHTSYPHDYALTTQDVMQLDDHGRSLCHAELTLENDIYIPDIQGQSALLRYQGSETWKLYYVKANPLTQGCTQASVTEAMVIEIDDLRGYSGNYTSVVLAPIGNDTWELEYAE